VCNSFHDEKMSYLCSISVCHRYLVNIAYTSAWLNHLNVLDEPNLWCQLVSHFEFIGKRSKRVRPAGGAREVGGVVLAMIPTWRFGSGSGLEPNRNDCNWFCPMKIPNHIEPADSWLVTYIRKPRTLAPIRHMSSDHITIWDVRTRCSFRYSINPHSPICNPGTICCIAVKSRQKLAIFQSNSTIIDGIANWGIEDESSVSNGSGQPASSQGFDLRFRLVWFQTRPKTRPALSWRVCYPDRT